MTIQQLLVLVYGNLMSSWGVARDGAEEKACAKWMVALRDRLTGQTTGLHGNATWNQCLSALILAASAYLRLEAEDKRTCSMIMSWGRRRCEKFMSNSSQSPLFGLHCASTMIMLDSATPLEAGIKYLRGIAQDMGVGPGDAIIRYKSWSRRSEVVQLATAIPHHRASSKRTAMNEQKQDNVHFRWLWCRPGQRTDTERCTCVANCATECPCAVKGTRCGPYCHTGTMEGCQLYGAVPVAQAKGLPTLPGEEIVLLSPDTTEITLLRQMAFCNLDVSSQKQYFVWMSPPPLYHNHMHPYQPIPGCPTLSHGQLHCQCASPRSEQSQYYHGAAFRLILGDLEGLGLFVRTQVETHDHEANFKLWYDRAVETLEKRSRSRTYIAGVPGNITTVPRLLSSYSHHIMDGMRDKSGDPTFRPAASKPFDIGDFVKLIGASCLTAQYRRSLRAIRCVNSIYQNLEGATIPLNVLDISLKEAKWLDYRRPVDDDGDFTDFEHFFPKRKEPMDRGFFPRASRFACIAMFESGIHNLDPSVFDPVVAMASANSLFVAAELVADPSELCQHAIKRVIGNVGRAGISLLVLPQLAPRVKELGYDWRAVPHEDYNFEREDNFQHTNLVLSFTEWSRPVQVAQRGSIGEDVFLIECVLSVHDRGKWVADIDPMNHNIMKWDVSCTCPKQVEPTLTAIDSWEELLDAPDNVAVFRANGNIYARLGAVAIRKSQGTDQQKRTLIVPPGVKPCFRCVGHLDKAVIID